MKSNKNNNGRVLAPAAKTRVVKTNKPQVKYLQNGDIEITHREYIGEVNGSVDFANTQYPVNPGMSVSFPWLAEFIGPAYETYRENALSYEFETEKGTDVSGSVMLAIDYDASDSAPVNKQQLMAYAGAVRSAVWNNVKFVASVDALNSSGPRKVVRLGELDANEDVKTYDSGTFNIATQGCADTTAIGELYVNYRTLFKTPQLDLAGVINSKSKKMTAGGTISKTAVFGTSTTASGGLSVTMDTNTITFNRVGQYLVSIKFTGSATSNATYTTTGTATAASLVEGVHNAGATEVDTIYLAQIDNRGETIVLDLSGATTITASVVRVAPFLYSLA